MMYLKSNSGGKYQPHQCAKGADLAITDYGAATIAEVVQLANLTCIAIPSSAKTPIVHFDSLGYAKIVNLYHKI